MPEDTSYDTQPVRPGAAPQITASTAGLTPTVNYQPAGFHITRALVKLFRHIFSVASRIENPNLVDRVWTSSVDSSPILITSLAEWRAQESNKRPAILVDRLDQDKSMAERGVGDQLMGVRPGYFAHVMTGAHVVHCLGAVEGEAEALASEVWRNLSRFAPVIRDKLCLLRFLPVKIGKRVLLDEQRQSVYTEPIVCQYGYLEQWRLRLLDETEITAIQTLLVEEAP